MKRGFCITVFFLLHYYFSFSQTGTLSVNGASTVCAGSSGSLTISGFSGTIFHWELTTDGGITWNNGVGTSPNQTFFMIPQTTCYRVILNSGADTSNMACVTVDQPSDPGTITGGGNFCGSTGPGTLTDAGSNGVAAGWFTSANGTTWTATGNSGLTQNYGVITSPVYYRFCTQNGVCPLACDSVFFNIGSAPTAGTITPPTSVCASGNSGNISISGSGGAVISWSASTNGGTSWTTDTTNHTTSISYSNLTQTTLYKVVVGSPGCPSDSATTTVTVETPGTGGSVNGGNLFCGTAGSGTLTLTGYSGNISGWQYSTNGGVTWTNISNTNAAYNYSGVTTTTLYEAIIGTGVCPIVYSSADTVFYFPASNAGVMSAADTVCAGNNSGILQLNGYTATNFEWFFSINGGITWSNLGNSNNPSYNYNNLLLTTKYAVVAGSGLCPIDTSNIITISVMPVTPVNAGSGGTINAGQTFQLNASGGTGIINWFPATSLSGTTILNPVASPTVTTTYVITVLDSNNCIAADSVTITVTVADFNGVVANTLTPNNDGINDSWYVENALNYTDTDVKIFNEFGMEIYSAAPYKNDWKGTYNGNKLPDGTYFYVLKFKNSNLTLKGTINLVSQ